MRIDRFHIRHYGPLSSRTLDFSGGCEGLHIVYGRNEWGKSLSLQSLEHALFSFPRRLDGFSDSDRRQLELELVLRKGSGHAASHLALKRCRQSLLDTNTNRPMDERQIQAFLGAADVDIFRKMYGLSAERIREGGQLLIKAKGDIADTLFAAATGVEHVRDITDSITSRHQKLFSSAGNATNPPLNNAIRQLRTSVQTYSSAVQSPEAVARLEKELSETERAFHRTEEDLSSLSTHRNRLNRLRSGLTPANELHAARQRLAALGDPTPLADTFRTRLDSARQTANHTAPLLEILEKALAEQQQQRDAIAVDSTILAAEETIDLLHSSAGKLQGFDESLPRRRAESQRLTRENEELMNRIAATTGRPASEAVSQSSETLKQIETLIQEYGGTHTAWNERSRQLESNRTELAELEEELSQHDALPDTTAQKTRLDAVRGHGELEDTIADKQGQFSSLHHELTLALKKLTGRQATTSVEELPVPSLEQVREFREAFRDHDQQCRRIDDEIKNAQHDVIDLKSRIALLEKEVELPTDAELSSCRKERDSRLNSVGHDVESGSLLPTHAPERFQELARLVDEADRLVDQLRSHADRASQRNQLHVAIETREKQIRQWAVERDQLDQQRASTQTQWRQLWEPTQVDPQSPIAMEAWLAAHSQCLQKAADARSLKNEIEQLERQIHGDRSELQQILCDLGSVPHEAARRRQLISETTAALEARQNRFLERQQKSEEIEKKKRELPHQERRLAEAQDARDSWASRWADCMKALDQPDNVSTDTGRFLLDAMRQIASNRKQIEAEEERISKMENERTSIHHVMQEVADVLGCRFDPNGMQALRQLAAERLRTAQKAVTNRENLDAQIADTERQVTTHKEKQSAAEAAFATLCEEAGVSIGDHAELDRAWNRSSEFRDLKAQVNKWEQEFLAAAGNADSETFLTECLAASIEQIDEELADIDQRITDLKPIRDKVRDRVHTLENSVAALGNDAATRAAEKSRMHEAEVVAHVREYLPLRLASIALQEATRRYRDEHHAPLLTRASTLFQQITDGRYSEIRLAENDLYAVRADATAESVLQRYMSEGTRDQVYLALRLAALEHSHNQGAEPLPLILDDGLVQFDDDRTAAMLRVLADVSAGMQVIVFTHHASVVTAARDLQNSIPDTIFLHGEAA